MGKIKQDWGAGRMSKAEERRWGGEQASQFQ